MHLYSNKSAPSEIIEFIGLNNHDLVFRYVGFPLESSFSMSKQDLRKYWIKKSA